jgi:hypothetical protein
MVESGVDGAVLRPTRSEGELECARVGVGQA